MKLNLNIQEIYVDYPKKIDKQTFEKLAKKYFNKKGYTCYPSNHIGYLRRDAHNKKFDSLNNLLIKKKLLDEFKKMIYYEEVLRQNGIPDLFVIKDDGCFFCEIKSEKDGLRISQLKWLYKNRYKKIKSIVLFIRDKKLRLFGMKK